MKRIFLICLAVGLLLANACSAEFQVNTRPTYNQTYPDVAVDGVGNFVVVWASYYQGGRSYDIFARTFLRDGSPETSEFQINTTTTGNQTEPSIAVDPSGNFVVAWQGPGPDEEDIYARKFDPNGQPLTGEFRINDYTPGSQLYPNVAVDDAGNIVIVWESSGTAQKPTKQSIYARLFDNAGSGLCPEFIVDDSSYNCRYPNVEMDASGNFVVTWLQDRTAKSIMARLYSHLGNPRTAPFEANTAKVSSLTRPRVAVRAEGSFVVTWDGDPKLASLDDIHARLYDPNGIPLTAQFTVNTSLAGAQQYPQVAMNSCGDFVIVWQSDDPNSSLDVFAQRFNRLGQTIGDEFRINTYTNDEQKYAAIALSETGCFLAAWQSNGQDSSGYGIFADILSLGSADLNGDHLVNFEDYAVFAAEWVKKQTPLRGDLICDDRINERDLVAFCQQWLIFTPE